MAEVNKPYTFVISDESINSYGFRVLTDGIDLSLFKQNPIALWVHKRMWGLKEEVLPIGRWENLRKEGGKLLGDLVFDDEDDFAVKLKKKVDKKIINMVSPGLRPLTWSDDPKHLEKGQTRETLIKSTLREVSLVDIGSNSHALRLIDEKGEELNLSDSGSVPLIPSIPTDIQNQNNDMKFQEQIAQLLKLSDNASEADILVAVQNSVSASVQLSDVQGQVTKLKDEKKTLETELQAYRDSEKAAKEQERVDLVDQAIADKKITADQKATYLNLAEKDFDSTKAVLDTMQGVKELGDNNGGEVKLGAWDARMKEIDEKIKNR